MQSLLQNRRLKSRILSRRDQEVQGSEQIPDKNNNNNNTNDEGASLLLVHSNGDDSTNPRSWSLFHRSRAFLLIWLLVFTQGWISTASSNVTRPASQSYGVSETAETLTTALFFLGLALGALFAGPLSETFGRNAVYLVSTAVLLCFTAGAAVTKSFGGELALRFLGGVASSPTLSIYGGTLADLFDDGERLARWPVFALSPLLGPVVAPIVGGWVSGNVDWRWTLWIGLAIAGVAFLLALFLLPETYSPILLFWKARHLRRITGNAKFIAKLELGEPLGKRLATNLTRPAVFFTTELIVILLGAYLVLVFVINFSFLNGLDFIFTQTYGLSSGITSLAFVSIAIGVLIDVSATPLYTRLSRRVYRRQCRAFVKRKELEPNTFDMESVASRTADHISATREEEASLPPELSLIRAAIAAPFLPVSLFWLGWTNYASINPASGYAATVVFGYALSAIFISSYQYIISSYETFSSSALASITVARYTVSAGMVVATRPMYMGIGVHWTMTILGSLAVLLVPAPWLLLRYGDRVRARSKFANSVNS